MKTIRYFGPSGTVITGTQSHIPQS